MNRKIFKYAIEMDNLGCQQHAIPNGSIFLDLQVQNGVPVMWWSVPTDQLPSPNDLSEKAQEIRSSWKLRTFATCPTGDPGYTDNMHYVGTYQLGAFVGHLMSWEEIPR